MPSLSRLIMDVSRSSNTLSPARTGGTLASAVLALEERRCIPLPRARCTAALVARVIVSGGGYRRDQVPEAADQVPAVAGVMSRPRSPVLGAEPDIDVHQAEQRQ